MTTLSTEQTTPDDTVADRLLGMLNGGALALMMSIGHRTGLFDAMAGMPPSTSDGIAFRAGLNERYVREWLGAMVTGQIVTYDSDLATYSLPPEYAALLTRAAAPDNMATTMQWIAVLGQVEDRIVECFRNGGGVPYACFSRFHEVMAEESDQTAVSALTEHILPLVPNLTERLTHGIDVLDVGCGRGHAMIQLASLFPGSKFTGYDWSAEAVEAAERRVSAEGLANVRFERRDAAQLQESSCFDLITAFDSIHDQVDPAGVLANVSQMLRPGGVFLMQDIAVSSHLEKNIDHPLAPFTYTISCMHCMTVSLAHGGAGLGAAWGKELACRMLDTAGFVDVTVHQLEHDFINNYYIAMK